MKHLTKLVFCAGLLSLLASPALAGAPLLSDPLTSWPLNFGAQGSSISLKNGAVHITSAAGTASWATYRGFNFTGQDASVTITPENTTGNAAGLLFWATGPSDYYAFMVSDSNGTFALYKHVTSPATAWQNIVPYMKTALLKAGAANTLRVVTQGNHVTL
jgi:hypothetical protein